MNELLRRTRPSRFLWSTAALLSTLAAASPASAHFILETPDATMTQGALGDPQKTPPCGGDGTNTGKVTAFQAGQVITITVDEKIFHPGHYRVSLAPNDPSELPAEPPVTAGSSACGSVPIMSPPVYPVLADGMLLHTQPFSGPQTFQVTLPSDVTCDHCTLQVIEFMSSHPLNNPGGCFYHHCANISITSVPVGAGGSSGEGGGSAAGGNAAGGNGTAGNPGNPPNTGGAAGSTSAAAGGASAVGGTGTGAGAGSGATSSTGGSGTAGTSAAAGSSATAGASASDAPASSGDSGGCAVSAPGAAGLSGALTLLGLAMLGRRRRR